MENVQPCAVGNELLNRFTLIEELKSRVFVAIDDFSGNKVVIKQAANEQLEREWHCMKQCHSSYVIQPIEILPSLLILPYIEGECVLTFSLNRCSLFVSCIPQIVRAIDCVHQAGWVHGDIKPSNIMFLPELGSIKLIDFGAAWPVETPLNQLSEWQLTPVFSRNTRQEGIGNVEKKDDWYALKIWLEQIDDNLLTSRDKSKLINWKKWLGNKLI